MKLLGAKEFLKTVKPGTLFVEFWMSHAKDCDEIIKNFENGVNLLEKYNGEFLVFGDNGGSLTFLIDFENYEKTVIDDHSYDCLFYYDHNIVGDASPYKTLNLVFESEDEWPEKIPIQDTGREEFLTKEDVKRIIKHFLEHNGPFSDEANEKALEMLEEECYKNNKIINYIGELKC